MKLTTKDKRPARILMLAMLAATGARAQTATTPEAKPAAEETPIVLEAFVATGSNIKRLDQEKVLPVTVFSSEAIEARDSATPMDLLAGIPQITNIPSNETSTNAVAGRGGNANVALRGLGATNTLVILNGRRMPFHPHNSSNQSSVNVNTLPTFGISQIEVLRDGASAIYGSDAVAGVVNYVTKKNADGGSWEVRYGVTEHGGGMDIQGNLRFGKTFAEGKGTWITSLTAYNRDAIYLWERESSANTNRSDSARAPWNVAGSAYDGSTSVGIWPQFFLGTSTTTTAASRYFYPTSGTTPSLTTTAIPRSLYTNYNQWTMGQPMSSRLNVHNRVEYEVTPSIKAFGEVAAYASKSITGRQPITLNVSDARVVLGVDNPYNPYGSRFFNATGTPNTDGTARITGTPQAITITSVLMTDGGPEKVEAYDDMYRVLGGLTGTIGTSSWTWETAAMIGGVRAEDFAVNSIRESRLKEAALRSGTDAWNPFGYTFKVTNTAAGSLPVADTTYVNPKEVRDYYTMNAKRFGHSKVASWDARASGNVFELWSGEIQASIGAEWRYEFKEDHKDPYVSVNPADSGLDVDNNDILVMSPKKNYAASRTIASGYAETVVPLMAPKNGVPLINSLEANTSVRFERYSDFGNTTKPKFALNWKPFEQVMVRASLNKGFRAPDLADLRQASSFTVASPPGNRDAVRNTYFQAAGLGTDTQVLNKTYTLNNPNLQPEESEGRSVGIAIEIPKIKGLSVSVDYWEITQNNLIISQTTTTGLDYASLLAYTQAQLAAGKDIMAIDVGSRATPSDTTAYAGDPYTLRAPVTDADKAKFAQTYAILPKSQWIAPLGTWIGASSQPVNSTGRNFTNGLDYNISYNLPRTRLGQFRFSTDWAQFLNKFTKTSATNPKNDDITSMQIAEWKGSATIVWKNGDWGASINATYSTDVRTGATATAAQYAALGMPDYIKPVTVYSNAGVGTVNYYEVGEDQLQINTGVSYRFSNASNKLLKGTTVRLGINNVLDEEPSPANVTGSGYAGGTGSSLWVGRAYTLNLSRDF